MGWDIRLEDERGTTLDEVGDPTNLLHALLPSPQDETSPCLRFIDPYGNTTFNRLQAAALLAELERLRPRAFAREAQQLVDRIIDLAQRCQSEPHLYMTFYGD